MQLNPLDFLRSLFACAAFNAQGIAAGRIPIAAIAQITLIIDESAQMHIQMQKVIKMIKSNPIE